MHMHRATPVYLLLHKGKKSIASKDLGWRLRGVAPASEMIRRPLIQRLHNIERTPEKNVPRKSQGSKTILSRVISSNFLKYCYV